MILKRTGGNTALREMWLKKRKDEKYPCVGDGNQITFCGFNQKIKKGDRDRAGRQGYGLQFCFSVFCPSNE
jgi:hypothetical protein